MLKNYQLLINVSWGTAVRFHRQLVPESTIVDVSQR